MKIDIKWQTPIRLKNGSSQNMIYMIDSLEKIPPRTAGVYVFLRLKGHERVPLYIGQATRLRSRIKGQLNNLKLMLGIKNAPGRSRFVACAICPPAQGQNTKKVLDVVENALIRYAMAEGHDILNIQGTNLRVDTITSAGNRLSRSWFPKEMLVEKKRNKLRRKKDRRKRSTRKPVAKREDPSTKDRRPKLAPFVTRRFMIRAAYKGKTYRAKVRFNGKINYNGTLYTSPSAAGSAIVPGACPGWDFWRYKNKKGEWVKLNELRKKR